MKISITFLLLTLLAEILGTIGGFGSSVFFVPIANFYFDFHTVLGITALFHLSSNISKILLFKKGLDKNLLIYLGIPSVIFVIIGGILSKDLSSHVLSFILGIFLIAFSLLFLIFKNLVIKPTKSNAAVGGILSGFSAGLLGTGGAIRGLTMAAFNLEKSVFIATSAAIDMMIDLTRSVVYYSNGYITQSILIYIPFLLVIGFVGTFIGKKILNYIPQESFRSISLILIFITGLVMLYNFFVNP
ncbi:MAG TPA: sulfite exporter TauE/SafE family protein [Saprospiraceae bacterium]|nr:sulfite exporter TauE/SafE family protein [Saprospiraceae bacterium]MCB9327324.1 sulfite exporter TauE/SafE family protein [Lewinellaceae bacterium]HPK10873.1 sulfite exporter TauE/SafE family protein [Saprospiraceae bacterium]HRX28236.1 sulfite exporter TauE/SafE family protein [Saprospiraceae bacterium]